LTALGTAGPGQTLETTARKSSGCQQLVAVITNVSETAANPDASEERSYALATR
jgi:hypothetical protein